MISDKLDAQGLVQAMLKRGWHWTEEDLLVHPADHDLAIRVTGDSNQLTLSPKLEAQLQLVIPTPASKGRFWR